MKLLWWNSWCVATFLLRCTIVLLRNKTRARQFCLFFGEGGAKSEVIRRLLRAEMGLYLPVADVDRPAINGLQEQLRKIGGNLNQAVRAMNAGRVGYEPALAKSLAALLGMVQPMNKRLAEMARPVRSRRSDRP
jgi:hypothetical protein